MEKIIKFPPDKQKRKPLSIKDVEQIGFLTVDDRDLWIKDPADILKLMKFIIAEKISIKELNE